MGMFLELPIKNKTMDKNTVIYFRVTLYYSNNVDKPVLASLHEIFLANPHLIYSIAIKN